MKDIDLLLPRVKALAATCPDLTALRHLRDAAKIVCRKSRSWRDWDEFNITTPDECESLCAAPDAHIVEIASARLDGMPLDPVTERWLDEEFGDWQSDDTIGTAKYVTQLSPNTLTIYPRATGLLKVRLILEPSDDAEQLPDFLVDQYSTEIGRAAAGWAMLTPNQEFTNPEFGAQLVAGFNAWAETLTTSAPKGQQKARIRTKPANF